MLTSRTINWRLFMYTKYQQKIKHFLLPAYRIFRHFLRTPKSIIKYIYFTFKKPHYGLNVTEEREKKIIVSLTSYPARLPTVHLAIKSILNQTYKPDKIILYLDDDVDIDTIGSKLVSLKQYGLTIAKRPENIKPHKKYYYAIKEHPDDIVITVDDDKTYNKLVLESLVRSYERNPESVSAISAAKILINENGEIAPYSEKSWRIEKSLLGRPSKQLSVYGCGGVLYPPYCMSDELFNLENIKKYSLGNDDIWLNIMQILNNTKIILLSNHKSLYSRESIFGSQKTSLRVSNEYNKSNDIYWMNLIRKYNIKPTDFIDE